MSDSYEQLVRAVAEFHNWIELPRLGHLSQKLMYQFRDGAIWSEQYYRDPSLVGCYAFENEANQLYYIGSVSANSNFGRRFANGYVCKDQANPQLISRQGNATNAIRIYVIDMPIEYAFLSQALEQFLITCLNPSLNAKDGVNALGDKLIDLGVIPFDTKSRS